MCFDTLSLVMLCFLIGTRPEAHRMNDAKYVWVMESVSYGCTYSTFRYITLPHFTDQNPGPTASESQQLGNSNIQKTNLSIYM